MVGLLDLPTEPIADGEAMHRLGRYLARQLGPGDALALIGPLGAGKTTLIQGLADGLGIDTESVVSPTFALVHHYKGGEVPLIHADLYRLGSKQEAEAAGLGDLLHDPEAIVAVEWPLLAADWLPRHTIWLQITTLGTARQVIQVLSPA